MVLSNRHVGKYFRLKYLAEQAEASLNDIDTLIATTERRAPIRTKEPYLLVRTEAGTPVGEEARWERAIWDEWHESQGKDFIPGVCRSILSYQVMLRDTNDDEGWGEVDRRPTVLEIDVSRTERCSVQYRHRWSSLP